MNDAMPDVATAVGADPDYGLQGPGAASQVQTLSDKLFLASLDQSNAFTYIEVPSWWRRYQGAPAIAAQEFPHEFLLQQGLEDCAPGFQLVPQCRRLAMGHMHAFFCVDGHQQASHP